MAENPALRSRYPVDWNNFKLADSSDDEQDKQANLEDKAQAENVLGGPVDLGDDASDGSSDSIGNFVGDDDIALATGFVASRKGYEDMPPLEHPSLEERLGEKKQRDERLKAEGKQPQG